MIHAYNHIVQHIQDLSDSAQQHTLHSMEENASTHHHSQMILQLPVTSISQIKILSQKMQMTPHNTPHALKQFGIHAQSKHKYRNTFDKSNIQYHDFNNQDSLTFTDKYITLLQQELQNPIGVYMIQLQLKVTNFQKIWTLKLCHIQCISPAIQIQSQRSIT